MEIIFQRGTVVPFEKLRPNSIALDGYVQGPQLDPKTRRFSFDHHTGCVRLVTKATCQQVADALLLGLTVDSMTNVYINDIDADTVLALWLLLNPLALYDQRASDVLTLVERIGLTDSHGPAFEPHELHSQLSPDHGEPQDLELLMKKVSYVDRYLEGDLIPYIKPDAAKGYGWNPHKGWFEVDKGGFTELYRRGAVLGFTSQAAPGGTFTYVVAKASDLVPVELGPGSTVRPVTEVEQFNNTVLGRLATLEQTRNPAQSLAHTWGGGSSVGGSPRNSDGTSSRLSVPDVLGVMKFALEEAQR